MINIPSTLIQFIEKLPDPNSGHVFLERLIEEHPSIAESAINNQELCANILTLAAYSPLLAETMLHHPDYINWLARERNLREIKPKEELMQELARFVSINSTLAEPSRLARFKRREFLRIYLRDCLQFATVSETIEELSNLADAVLERTVQHCYQPLLARYGKPRQIDDRGRLNNAEFVIIGMGKLGSRELNYSSDIDLIFIYSADGDTDGGSESIPNKLFFIKLAEAIVKIVSTPFGEGAVFRVDMRLRPRGREGALVVSLAEAIRYYQKEAQTWERQALVRARASAGDSTIVDQLLLELRDYIFLPAPLINALRDVKLAKEKIDRNIAMRPGGFNVKLGKGGIREIEFIVQALQICYGGLDSWLRIPQTVIGLQRLADKDLISDKEHTYLAQAYNFLRMVEHRLQMENGLQTHSLPLSEEKLLLLARRCGYYDFPTFNKDLQEHCHNVSTIYQRVFAPAENSEILELPQPSVLAKTTQTAIALPEELVTIISNAGVDRSTTANLFPEIVSTLRKLNPTLEEKIISNAIATGLTETVNIMRALKRVRDYVLSALSEQFDQYLFTEQQLRELTIICGSSYYFTQFFLSSPHLIKQLGATPLPLDQFNSANLAKQFIDVIQDCDYELANAKLRIMWHEEMIKIGWHDLIGPKPDNNKDAIVKLKSLNLAQTALAEAALIAATKLACNEVASKYQRTNVDLCFTILALGRLGHAGIDYNSDLDLIFVYADQDGDVAKDITNQEFYARIVEALLQILTTLKREGFLYSVDMRLRPDGRNGLLATSFDNLLQYLNDRAAIWELLAYLKLRPVVGNDQFNRLVATKCMAAIFARAKTSDDSLATEVNSMRKRLEREKGRSDDYKAGVGGMLDVYFITRYLQLRDGMEGPAELGTLSLIAYLSRHGLLTKEQGEILINGYAFLRRLDHEVRLQLERPQTAMPNSETLRQDLARRLNFDSDEVLINTYQTHRRAIREIYKQIFV